MCHQAAMIMINPLVIKYHLKRNLYDQRVRAGWEMLITHYTKRIVMLGKH